MKAADHPMIMALFNALPAPHTHWSADNRRRWLRMAEETFDFVYARDRRSDVEQHAPASEAST